MGFFSHNKIPESSLKKPTQLYKSTHPPGQLFGNFDIRSPPKLTSYFLETKQNPTMGKSLRSKSKLKFRTIKRATGVFGKTDRERANRLAEKLGTARTAAAAEAEAEGEDKEDKEGVMETDEGM